jgi:hypothetical protein
MKWVVLVAHMGEIRNTYKILIGKPGRDRSEDLSRDWRILDWVLE